MPGQHSVGLKKAIQDHKPDVIIYDSLIQLHNLSENDNVQMKAVMRELRRISSYQKEGRTESVAHIILHHTRKPSAKEARDPSAAMMRGAGSIHAAADLVMTINKDSNESPHVRVSFSARSARPPEGRFQIELQTQTHAWIPLAEDTTQKEPGARERKRAGFLKLLKTRAKKDWQVVIGWIDGNEDGLPTTPITVQGHLAAIAKSKPAGLEIQKRNPRPHDKPKEGSLGYWIRRAGSKSEPVTAPDEKEPE
jgi:hypothetical protein